MCAAPQALLASVAEAGIRSKEDLEGALFVPLGSDFGGEEQLLTEKEPVKGLREEEDEDEEEEEEEGEDEELPEELQMLLNKPALSLDQLLEDAGIEFGDPQLMDEAHMEGFKAGECVTGSSRSEVLAV